MKGSLEFSDWKTRGNCVEVRGSYDIDFFIPADYADTNGVIL